MIATARLLAPWWRRALAWARRRRIVRRCPECGEPLATASCEPCYEVQLCRAMTERARIIRDHNARGVLVLPRPGDGVPVLR